MNRFPLHPTLPPSERIRACDAAVLVLRETDNPAVMWSDSGLLHAIASRAGLRSRERGWQTEGAVLAALSKQPGDLVATKTAGHKNRSVRIFWLREKAPAWALADEATRRASRTA